MDKLFAIAVWLLLILPVDALAKPGGGGKSFSGGGRSGGGSVRPSFKPSVKPSVTPRPSFTPKPSISPKPAGGKSFSGSPAPAKGISSTKPPTVSPSIKPKTVSVDMKAVRDHGTVESRTVYKAALQKSESPKTSYTSKGGKTVNVNPSDKKVESVRKMDHDKWINRETRVNKTYHVYQSRPSMFPATAIYHDSFNPWFFMWLMDRSRDDRALWMYHHKSDMDPERYKYLTSKDSQLESRIRQLEIEKLQKDPSYAPKDLDPDLQYDDDFVDAAVNPHKTVPHEEVSSGGGGSWVWLGWLCSIVVIGLIIWGIAYFVFYYEY